MHGNAQKKKKKGLEKQEKGTQHAFWKLNG